MQDLKLHTNEFGHGETVICLHGSASNSGQWRRLMERLSGNFHVIAPDLYGYGKSQVWNGGQELSLDEEAALLQPILDREDEPVHLIGHSFGGALAFKVALRNADKVKSLTVYEPVLFKLLFDADYTDSAASEIRNIRDVVYQQLEERQPHEAARIFVNYWNGEGAWERLDSRRHSILAGSMRSVLMNFDSLFSDSSNLADFTELNIPVLYLHGAETPSPTRRITELLTAKLPQLEFCVLPGAGHMGPVTHAENVNEIIVGFLERNGNQIVHAASMPMQKNADPIYRNIARCLRQNSPAGIFVGQDSRSRLSMILSN